MSFYWIYRGLVIRQVSEHVTTLPMIIYTRLQYFKPALTFYVTRTADPIRLSLTSIEQSYRCAPRSLEDHLRNEKNKFWSIITKKRRLVDQRLKLLRKRKCGFTKMHLSTPAMKKMSPEIEEIRKNVRLRDYQSVSFPKEIKIHAKDH